MQCVFLLLPLPFREPVYDAALCGGFPYPENGHNELARAVSVPSVVAAVAAVAIVWANAITRRIHVVVQPGLARAGMSVCFYAARTQLLRKRVAAVPRLVYGMHVFVNDRAFNSAQLGNDVGVVGVIRVVRHHPFGAVNGLRGFGRRQMQYETNAVQRNVRRGVHNAREFALRRLILSCRAKMHVRRIKPVWINKKTHSYKTFNISDEYNFKLLQNQMNDLMVGSCKISIM